MHAFVRVTASPSSAVAVNLTTCDACYLDEPKVQPAGRAARRLLKRRAKLMFGLRANAPAWLVADRYEDAGMAEEAALLRR